MRKAVEITQFTAIDCHCKWPTMVYGVFGGWALRLHSKRLNIMWSTWNWYFGISCAFQSKVTLFLEKFINRALIIIAGIVRYVLTVDAKPTVNFLPIELHAFDFDQVRRSSSSAHLLTSSISIPNASHSSLWICLILSHFPLHFFLPLDWNSNSTRACVRPCGTALKIARPTSFE